MQRRAKELKMKLLIRNSVNILNDKRLFVYLYCSYSIAFCYLNSFEWWTISRIIENEEKKQRKSIGYNFKAENVLNKLRILKKQLSILWQRPWLNKNKCDDNDDALFMIVLIIIRKSSQVKRVGARASFMARITNTKSNIMLLWSI